jgi:hypothetical protein
MKYELVPGIQFWIIVIFYILVFMNPNERDRLIELVTNAVAINEKLLSEEKNFINAVSGVTGTSSLQKMNEQLNDLCSKEHLYLAASKSLLQIMSNR